MKDNFWNAIIISIFIENIVQSVVSTDETSDLITTLKTDTLEKIVINSP